MYYIRYINSRVKGPGEGSAMNKLQWKRSACVPGHIGDKTSRGQPRRFDKWYKLPESAHRLYWRFHEN